MPAAELPARLSADTLALPAWAADALLHGTLPPGKEGKAAFILLPLEGSELPSLLQSRCGGAKGDAGGVVGQFRVPGSRRRCSEGQAACRAWYSAAPASLLPVAD